MRTDDLVDYYYYYYYTCTRDIVCVDVCVRAPCDMYVRTALNYTHAHCTHADLFYTSVYNAHV